MIDLNDYFYFVHVVDKKGFSAAARILGVPKSRLSRHIARLEDRLQVKLIQRTSRQFKVTETGLIFYRHAKVVVDEVRVAEAAIQTRRDILSGRVVLSCSVGVAQFAIQDLVIEFLRTNPRVELVQQVTNQNIDMVSSGIDLAIRGHTGQLPDSSVIQRYLATVSWHLFASPDYLASHGQCETPHDLAKRQCLKVGWQPESLGYWDLSDETDAQVTVPISPYLSSDDMGTLKQAAIDGLGIVSLPTYTCRTEIDSGALVRVLPKWVSGKAQLSLLTPSRRAQSSSVKAFCQFLVDNLQARVHD